jgi:Rod binding domain-containing protein
MQISPIAASAVGQLPAPQTVAPKAAQDDPKLREAFGQFVGETFFGQMLKAMRKTQNKPAYFHGGRGEEVFQQQLDQVLAEKLTAASSQQFSEPMMELFMLQRG